MSGMGGRGAAATSVTERSAAAAARDDRAPRTLLLDQRIRYCYSGPVTNLRQRLKIVPPTAHGRQRRQHWHLRVDGVQSWSTRTYLDSFGNVTVDVNVPRVDDAVEFALDVEADTSGSAYETIVDQRYRRPTRLTAPDDGTTGLTAGAGGPDAETLCERVHESIDYEGGVTGIRTTAGEALSGGRGVCQDYAHIMLTTCRIAGLAARYVSGHLTGEGGSHAWVEVLRPHPNVRGNWIAEGWDPTHNRRTDADYLVVAVGRDYSDVAPLSGTYDGPDASNTVAVDKRLRLATRLPRSM
jgi:transglutaminase-like putative cysteine protease